MPAVFRKLIFRETERILPGVQGRRRFRPFLRYVAYSANHGRSSAISNYGAFEPTKMCAGADTRVVVEGTHRHNREVSARIVEDLHWLDGESEAFLAELGETLGSARLLLVASHRPEHEDRWGKKTYFTRLRLDPLPRESASEILESLLGSPPELEPLKRLAIEKAEGNPFFIEEIVRELFERGILVRNGSVELTRPIREISIPPTIQGVLAARIDRLEPVEKEVVQSAAVIGRGFTLALVEAVTGRPPEDLRELLTRLQRAELVYERPAFPASEYTFKHALTREVAYESVLIERRKLLHERAAQAIEGLYADRLEERYGELAYHYSHGGNAAKAIDYLHRAALQAIQRSVSADAIDHLHRALELLRCEPESRERSERELEIQLALGVALQTSKGEGSCDVGQAYDRARDLCREIGLTPRLSTALWGMWLFYLASARLETARELAEELRGVAESSRDRILLQQAPQSMGMTLFYLGDLTRAESHLEQAVAKYDFEKDRRQAFVYGLDRGVPEEAHSLSYKAFTLWFLGHSDRALAESERALEIAKTLEIPYITAINHDFAAALRVLRREAERAREHAEAAIAIAIDQGMPQWQGLGAILRGWALSRQGRAEGLAEILSGMAMAQSAGAAIMAPLAFWLLADACRMAGQTDRAMVALDVGLAVVRSSGEHVFEPELLRLKGELLATSGGTGEAESCFRQAIELARQQHARSQELRATISLSRLLAQRGSLEEARTRLAEIYSQFTEGFETVDLVEARTVLGALRSGSAGAEVTSGDDASTGDVNVFRKERDFWTIAYAGKVSRLRDAKGIRCIAHLLRHPGQEFHVIELEAAIEGSAPASAPEKRQVLGRTRKVSSPAERARVNLTKTVHDALARLAKDNPALGRHLRATLRTGYVFRYEPDPSSPTVWRL